MGYHNQELHTIKTLQHEMLHANIQHIFSDPNCLPGHGYKDPRMSRIIESFVEDVEALFAQGPNMKEFFSNPFLTTLSAYYQKYSPSGKEVIPFSVSIPDEKGSLELMYTNDSFLAEIFTFYIEHCLVSQPPLAEMPNVGRRFSELVTHYMIPAFEQTLAHHPLGEAIDANGLLAGIEARRNAILTMGAPTTDAPSTSPGKAHITPISLQHPTLEL